MGSSCWRTRLISVVFPAPDGPETMNNVPSGWKLLDILYLLADALYLGFQFDHKHSNVRGARLRAHGVDLTEHLLGEEVQLLAGRLLPCDGLLGLFDVMCQPCQFLGDVSLLDHDRHFLGDPILVDVGPGLRGNLLNPLTIRGQELAADRLAMGGQLVAETADRGQARGDVRLQRPPFPSPHGLHLCERLAYQPGPGLALLLGDLGFEGVYLQ